MERLANFVVAFKTSQTSVQSGPFPDSEICHRHQGYPAASETITITCSPSATVNMARYVYMYLPDTGNDRVLSMCEFEVYAYEGEIDDMDM